MKKKKQQKAIEKPKETPYKKVFIVAYFVLIILNFVLFGVIVVFIALIQFSQVKKSKEQIIKNTSFSYFLNQPQLLLSSKALEVYDVNSQVSLLSKNNNLRFSPASTVKIMSSIVALSVFTPDQILTVEKLETRPDISKMGLYVGEKISVLGLLYGMMLPSGGDAADVLADNYPGGREAFVAAMNKKAHEIGMVNTHFVDPSGYSDENYSTASDLSKLGAYALRDRVIREIVKTKEISLNAPDGSVSHKLKNLNELLDISGVVGVKTGFTNEAEGVLVTSYVKNNKTFIIVILGSKDRFADTRLLIEAIIKDLKSESYVES
jgi:D-alanyl-D-alanine carboxypeptidase